MTQSQPSPGEQTNEPVDMDIEIPESDADEGSGENSSARPGNQPIEAVTAERDAFQQKWLLALADLDTYRRRSRKEAEEQRRFAVLPLAEDLLPALDNLQRALDAAKTASDVAQLVQGVQMVSRQFGDILAKHQIIAIESVGKQFDPNIHQALQQMPSAEHPPMTVLIECERGYQMHDRVVRPSTVIVASPPAG